MLAERPTIFDSHVLPLDEAAFAEALPEGHYEVRCIIGRSRAEISNDRHRRLLRTYRKRPRDCRAGNDFDEISPAHVTLRSEVKHEASFQSLSD